MEIIDIVTIIALFTGPIFAVQVQKFIENNRSNRNRKIEIFKTLMATRGTTLSNTHVGALNRIDLEFNGKEKYQKVIEYWKEYFDHLGDDNTRINSLNVWADKKTDLLVNLLYEMGKSLGYKFDKTLIKRNIYSPQGHAIAEFEQEQMRKGILDILEGKSSLPISNILDEGTLNSQKELQEMLIDYYKNDKPFNVKVVD